MRDIRFRAWNPADKRMFDWSELAKLYVGTLFGDMVKTTESYGVILMEFTGLYDKNGKEIYSADILGGDAIRGGYEVFWNEHKAAWDVKGGSGYLTSWMNSFTSGLEVVGNIYENPDLLK